MLLQAHEEHGLALPFLARARDLEPDELRWEYYLGVAHASLGRHSDAAHSFQRCAVIDRTFLPAKRRLARARIEQQLPEDGLVLYRELLDDNPRDPELLYGLGRAEAALGNLVAARDHLILATEVAPGFGQAHYELALLYRDRGEDGASRRHMALFEENKDSAPLSDDPLLRAVRGLRVGAAEYLRRGVEAKNAGRTREAIALHLRALEEDPSLLQAHVNLLILYGAAEQSGAAEEHYRRGLELDGESAELHYNFGVLAYREGRSQAAEEAFRKALAANPGHALANHNLGQMLEEKGRFEEAMGFYRRALENRPDHGLSHYKIGMLWLRKRNASEAARSFAEAAREDSDRKPTYLFYLAGSRLAAGEAETAAATFRRAREEALRYGQTEVLSRIDDALSRLERPSP